MMLAAAIALLATLGYATAGVGSAPGPTQDRASEMIEEFLPRFLEDGHRDVPEGEWRQTAEATLVRKETLALVRRSIDELPESYRSVILLRDIEELDTGEAARALGVSENAVKIRLHRARQALRTLLDPHLRGSAK